MKKKLIRITTSYISLDKLLKGQLNFLSHYYTVVGVASGEDELRKVTEREGIRTVHIPMKREISLLRDLKSLLAIISLIQKEKPYIVHANTPKGSLLAMIAAMICRVPHRIYTVTGLRFETTTGFYKKVLILMERITCACATKVVPEGDGVKKTLLSEKITKKPLQKILNGNINGIDLKYFDNNSDIIPYVNELFEKDNFTFVFVGRLVKEKGINELVSAFNRLSELQLQTYNIQLLLVGWLETELDPLLSETLKTINSNPNILALGYKEDVRPYLAAADAMILPSYREGFPSVLLQAGAMGLPSIVTDISGCNEIILEGINGVIIPPKNEVALFNAMFAFIENPAKVKQMANNSRELIATRYEQKMVWQAILETYQNLEVVIK